MQGIKTLTIVASSLQAMQRVNLLVEDIEVTELESSKLTLILYELWLVAVAWLGTNNIRE